MYSGQMKKKSPKPSEPETPSISPNRFQALNESDDDEKQKETMRRATPETQALAEALQEAVTNEDVEIATSIVQILQEEFSTLELLTSLSLISDLETRTKVRRLVIQEQKKKINKKIENSEGSPSNPDPNPISKPNPSPEVPPSPRKDSFMETRHYGRARESRRPPRPSLEQMEKASQQWIDPQQTEIGTPFGGNLPKVTSPAIGFRAGEWGRTKVKPPQVKLPKWDPENPTLPVKEFMFLLDAQIPDCSAAEQLTITAECFQGTANKFYWSFASNCLREGQTFDEALLYARAKLIEVFDLQSPVQTDKEYRETEQNEDDLATYFQKKLLAYQKAISYGNKYATSTTVALFLSGLRNQQLAQSISVYEPQTVHEAYKKAAQTSDIPSMKARGNRYQPVTINNLTAQWSNEDEENLLDVIMNYISSGTTRKCWTCGEPGHLKPECPKRNNYRGNNNNNGSNNFGNRNNYRGNNSHNGSNNFGNRNNYRGNHNNGYRINNLVEVEEEQPAAEELNEVQEEEIEYAMEHHSFSNTVEEKKGLTLTAMGTLHGSDVSVLFDTGATTSAIREDTCTRLGLPILRTDKAKITGVDGITTSVGRALLNLKFDSDKTHVIPAIVLKQMPVSDIIIGDDVLVDWGAKISLSPEESTLVLGDGESIPLSSTDFQNRAIGEKVVVQWPARS